MTLTPLDPTALYAALGDPIVEELTPRLTVETYLDGHIVYYLITGISREGSDVFFGAGEQHFQRAIERNMPALYIIEIRANVTFTPYFRTRSEEFVKAWSHIHGHAGYIFKGGVLLNIIKSFILNLQSKRWRSMEFREFKDKDAALAWLYEKYRATQA